MKQETLHTILGKEYENFTADSTKKIPALIDSSAEGLPNLLLGYKYPVSSWPVIIENDNLKNLEQLCVKIPELLKKIPDMYFGNDSKKIADFYFQGNEMIAQFALLCHKKQIEIGCRLDLSLSSDGFKILEVNVGSSIGGWQVQSFEHLIRGYHPELDKNFKTQNTQSNYINFLVDKIIEYVSPIDTDINVFIGFGKLTEDIISKDITDFFDILLEKSFRKKRYKGKSFVGEFSDLSLQGNALMYKNKEMHTVLVITLDKTGMPPDIFRAFMMEKIYFPDHLATDIYGDKRNLGLLRELAEHQKFTPEENELVLNGIPWTKEIKNTTSIYKGKEANITEILTQYKDEMVVKAAQGYQGKDVFIGKFLSDTEWQKAIRLALENKNFIAQEFSDSINYIAPNKNNEWTPHKLIWGAFGFGKKYGGVWVRMSEVANDVGVINSATGAIEAIVYEAYENVYII